VVLETVISLNSNCESCGDRILLLIRLLLCALVFCS